jgi:U2-associated protein SR140
MTDKEKWLAKVPDETEKFIRAVAAKVKEHGKGLEGMLKEKEKDNPKFSFFFQEEVDVDSRTQEHR